MLDWQWSARESTAAWAALLECFPAPAVIVCDGGTGIASAVRQAWPETQVQHPSSRTHPTHHETPETTPGAVIKDPAEPDYYGTGLSADEGYWARSGWAGRA